MMNDLKLKGGIDGLYDFSGNVKKREQKMGDKILKNQMKFDADPWVNNLEKFQVTKSIGQFTQENNYLPQYSILRALTQIKASAGHKFPTLRAMATDRNFPVIDTRLAKGATEEFFQQVVRPKQSLLDSEQIAIKQLQAGIGQGRLFQLPMQQTVADQIMQNMDTAVFSESIINPQNKNIQQPVADEELVQDHIEPVREDDPEPEPRIVPKKPVGREIAIGHDFEEIKEDPRPIPKIPKKDPVPPYYSDIANLFKQEIPRPVPVPDSVVIPVKKKQGASVHMQTEEIQRQDQQIQSSVYQQADYEMQTEDRRVSVGLDSMKFKKLVPVRPDASMQTDEIPVIMPAYRQEISEVFSNPIILPPIIERTKLSLHNTSQLTVPKSELRDMFHEIPMGSQLTIPAYERQKLSQQNPYSLEIQSEIREKPKLPQQVWNRALETKPLFQMWMEDDHESQKTKLRDDARTTIDQMIFDHTGEKRALLSEHDKKVKDLQQTTKDLHELLNNNQVKSADDVKSLKDLLAEAEETANQLVSDHELRMKIMEEQHAKKLLKPELQHQNPKMTDQIVRNNELSYRKVDIISIDRSKAVAREKAAAEKEIKNKIDTAKAKEDYLTTQLQQSQQREQYLQQQLVDNNGVSEKRTQELLRQLDFEQKNLVEITQSKQKAQFDITELESDKSRLVRALTDRGYEMQQKERAYETDMQHLLERHRAELLQLRQDEEMKQNDQLSMQERYEEQLAEALKKPEKSALKQANIDNFEFIGKMPEPRIIEKEIEKIVTIDKNPAMKKKLKKAKKELDQLRNKPAVNDNQALEMFKMKTEIESKMRDEKLQKLEFSQLKSEMKNKLQKKEISGLGKEIEESKFKQLQNQIEDMKAIKQNTVKQDGGYKTMEEMQEGKYFDTLTTTFAKMLERSDAVQNQFLDFIKKQEENKGNAEVAEVKASNAELKSQLAASIQQQEDYAQVSKKITNDLINNANTLSKQQEEALNNLKNEVNKAYAVQATLVERQRQEVEGLKKTVSFQNQQVQELEAQVIGDKLKTAQLEEQSAYNQQLITHLRGEFNTATQLHQAKSDQINKMNVMVKNQIKASRLEITGLKKKIGLIKKNAADPDLAANPNAALQIQQLTAAQNQLQAQVLEFQDTTKQLKAELALKLQPITLDSLSKNPKLSFNFEQMEGISPPEEDRYSQIGPDHSASSVGNPVPKINPFKLPGISNVLKNQKAQFLFQSAQRDDASQVSMQQPDFFPKQAQVNNSPFLFNALQALASKEFDKTSLVSQPGARDAAMQQLNDAVKNYQITKGINAAGAIAQDPINESYNGSQLGYKLSTKYQSDVGQKNDKLSLVGNNFSALHNEESKQINDKIASKGVQLDDKNIDYMHNEIMGPFDMWDTIGSKVSEGGRSILADPNAVKQIEDIMAKGDGQAELSVLAALPVTMAEALIQNVEQKTQIPLDRPVPVEDQQKIFFEVIKQVKHVVANNARMRTYGMPGSVKEKHLDSYPLADDQIIAHGNPVGQKIQRVSKVTSKLKDYYVIEQARATSNGGKDNRLAGVGSLMMQGNTFVLPTAKLELLKKRYDEDKKIHGKKGMGTSGHFARKEVAANRYAADQRIRNYHHDVISKRKGQFNHNRYPRAGIEMWE